MRPTTKPAAIPDRHTGEPRPPTAPRTTSAAKRTTPPGEPTTEIVVPHEMGRPLEWCEESKRYPARGAVFFLCFMLVTATIVYQGFEWIHDWILVIIVVGLPAMVFFDMRKDRVIAGAGWVQERDKWVSVYELTKIRSTTVGYNRASKLTDARGNKLTLILPNAQENPKLWDLVYNGIAHSVAEGCDISKAARRILKV